MEKESTLIRYQLEYPVNSSPRVLYNFLSSPSGLSEWFCDDVDIRDNTYTFKWDDDSQKATLLSAKPGKSIRFKWDDMPEDTFFEFAIQVDDLTKDVALIITDFVSEEDEESTKMLWNSQIDALKHSLGS